jgi:LemA protein
MTAMIAFWLALALLLFWALGAYNRLVRLRGQVKSSFEPVDQRLGQVLDLLTPGVVAEPQEEPVDKPIADSDGLYAAATQLTQSLRMARKHPLDANAVAAFKTAFDTMHVAWQRHQADGDGRSDPQSPTPLLDQRSWDDHTQLAREAMETYNQTVLAYNGAIGQFPAILLAYLFGFRAAQCL